MAHDPTISPAAAIPDFDMAIRLSDARDFIGERDGDKLEGLALHELLRKGSQRIALSPLPKSSA